MAYAKIHLKPRKVSLTTPDYGIQFNVTNHYITPEGMVSEPIQSNKIDIDHSGYDTHLNITPEMNLQYEVYKGLRIS